MSKKLKGYLYSSNLSSYQFGNYSAFTNQELSLCTLEYGLALYTFLSLRPVFGGAELDFFLRQVQRSRPVFPKNYTNGMYRLCGTSRLRSSITNYEYFGNRVDRLIQDLERTALSPKRTFAF